MRSSEESLAARIDHVLVGDYQIGERGKRYLSLGLLLVAAAVGLSSFTTSYWFFWSKTVTLRPDFFSGLVAVLILGSLVARKLIIVTYSVYGILSLCLNATVLAILSQGLLGATAGFLTKLPMPYILGAAVLFTWGGI